MATTARAAERTTSSTSPEPIDTSKWPPMPDDLKAAYLRMSREPHLFDEFGDDDWVVFSGDEIVAAGPDLEEVLETVERAGKPVTLIVPMMGGWL